MWTIIPWSYSMLVLKFSPTTMCQCPPNWTRRFSDLKSWPGQARPGPAHLLTQPAQYSLGCQLWFPLSDRQVEKISQDFTLFYTTYFPLLSNPTNLSQASVQISTISLSCDATIITFRERDKLFLPGLHLWWQKIWPKDTDRPSSLQLMADWFCLVRSLVSHDGNS